MNGNTRQARQIQEAINHILFTYWDPIGMNDALPKDEYQAYVAEVYRALVNGTSENGLVSLLTSIENESIGLRAPLARKEEAARRLCVLKFDSGLKATPPKGSSPR
jgi:hypothetical protein